MNERKGYLYKGLIAAAAILGSVAIFACATHVAHADETTDYDGVEETSYEMESYDVEETSYDYGLEIYDVESYGVEETSYDNNIVAYEEEESSYDNVDAYDTEEVSYDNVATYEATTSDNENASSEEQEFDATKGGIHSDFTIDVEVEVPEAPAIVDADEEEPQVLDEYIPEPVTEEEVVEEEPVVEEPQVLDEYIHEPVAEEEPAATYVAQEPQEAIADVSPVETATYVAPQEEAVDNTPAVLGAQRPQTGDLSEIIVYIVVIISMVAMIAIVLALRRKTRA